MYKNCLNQKHLSLVRFLQYQLLNCKRKIHLDKNLLQIMARMAMKFLKFLNSQGSPQTIIKFSQTRYSNKFQSKTFKRINHVNKLRIYLKRASSQFLQFLQKKALSQNLSKIIMNIARSQTKEIGTYSHMVRLKKTQMKKKQVENLQLKLKNLISV